jgi:YVTN family beta-propeller protein
MKTTDPISEDNMEQLVREHYRRRRPPVTSFEQSWGRLETALNGTDADASATTAPKARAVTTSPPRAMRDRTAIGLRQAGRFTSEAGALAAILIVALLAGLFALLGSIREQVRTTLPVTTPTALPIATISATVDLSAPPPVTEENATAPWFLDVADHVLAQVDPANNQVLASFKVPDDSVVVASADNSLWLARTNAGVVERRDPHDGHVLTTITLETGLRAGMAVSPGTVWVASGKGNHVWRIDTATNRVTATINVGQFPRSLAVGGNALWVCSRDDEQGLWRIDTETNQVVAKVEVTGGVAPCGGVSVASDGAVWVINWNDATDENTLVRVDPDANIVTDSIPLGTGVAFGFVSQTSAIWAVSSTNNTLLRVDPQKHRLAGQLKLDNQPVQVVFAGNALWAQAGVTDSSGNLVNGSYIWRLTPVS